MWHDHSCLKTHAMTCQLPLVEEILFVLSMCMCG